MATRKHQHQPKARRPASWKDRMRLFKVTPQRRKKIDPDQIAMVY